LNVNIKSITGPITVGIEDVTVVISAVADQVEQVVATPVNSAQVRVWSVRHCKPGPPLWLMFRRSLESNSKIKY